MWGDLAMRTPLALLERVRFEDNAEILCARCQAPLDRHQPHTEQPERQLGTCLQCGAWHLIDEAAGVMYTVPDVWQRTDGGD